jgi:hypothetical protein
VRRRAVAREEAEIVGPSDPVTGGRYLDAVGPEVITSDDALKIDMSERARFRRVRALAALGA